MEDEPASEIAVPFGMSTEFENLRLVELPQAVLDEVLKEGKPLSLKSTAGENGGTALICTRNQTFEVRQMQSSNLLLLAEAYADEDTAESSLRAISQPKGMLELLPKAVDVLSWLYTNLPICQIDIETGQAVEPEDTATTGWRSKKAWMKGAPCSDHEFEQAWNRACTFELDDVAVIASPKLVVSSWKSIYTGALLRGIDLTSSVSADQFYPTTDEDGIPRGAVVAVLRRASLQHSDAILVDETIVVPWLGEMVLRSTGEQALNKKDFLQKWQDLLPEKWRVSAVLSSIDGKYTSPTDVTITARGSSMDSGPPKGAKKPASKWHEKLKASRK